MFKIGDITIENPVVVAPMAGITNPAFRSICQSFGAGLIYTEMVSDKGIEHANARTLRMTKVPRGEKTTVLHLFGNDVKAMQHATKYVDLHSGCGIIDLNAGCPVPKVVKHGAGAALMKTPELLRELVRTMVEATDKPVTVKIRSGWDKNTINAVEIAKICEEAGASAITVHGRTKTQMYKGRADYSIIKQVKQNVKIPVIGNGDVETPEDAQRMLETTGVDAVMIGRGLRGNPWLIKHTVDYLKTGSYGPMPTPQEIIEMIKRHTELLCLEMSEKRAVLEMRSHAPWYLKGLKHSAALKRKIVKVHTREELFGLLDRYLESF